MRFLVKLAVRNLRRNTRRTALTLSALALGIALLIGADSFSGGFADVGVRNVIDYESGHIRVHAPGYFEDRDDLPLDRTVKPGPVLSLLERVDGVQAAAPRVWAGARLNVGWEEFPVVAVAIDPERDPDVFRLQEYVQGRSLTPGATEAMVGAGVAELLELEIGDYITLVLRTRNQSLQAFDLQVVGLLRTPHSGVNEGHIYFPLDVAESALALEGGVTEVVLRVTDEVALGQVNQNVRDALSSEGIDAEVFTWRESAADLLALAQSDQASNFILTTMILIIALVGVTNTILLGALERRREIGTMKAMGMREGEIVRLFLLEATGIGLMAALVGSAIGVAINVYLVEVGVDFSTLAGDVDLGFPIVGRVYGSWNTAMFFWGSIAGVLTCWVAAYLPARRAAKEDPANSVRV